MTFKNLVISILLVLFSLPFYAQQIEWENSFGGSDFDWATSIDETNDGGYIMTGYSGSTDKDFQGTYGGADYWVVKMDSVGNAEWKRNYGSSGGELVRCIKQTNDNGFILAGSSDSSDYDVSANYGQEDIWILKLDNSGNIEWEQNYGGSLDDQARNIIQTEDNGFAVTGFSKSSDYDMHSNHGGKDIFVLKIDNTGNLQWVTNHGGSDGEDAHCIIQTQDQGFMVTGYTISSDHDVNNNYGGRDAWILKLNNSGTVTRKKNFGGSKKDAARFIRKSHDGNYVVAGYSVSYDHDLPYDTLFEFEDYWAFKLDSSSWDLKWSRVFGTLGQEFGTSIQRTYDNGFILSGYAYPGGFIPGHGGSDIWILKLNDKGKVQWDKNYGSSGRDYPSPIYETSDGGYILASSVGEGDYDVSSNNGQQDFWALKLKCPPTRSTIDTTTCGTYTVPSGDKTYYKSGTYYDTIRNFYGCDSIIKINLDSKNSFDTIHPHACNNYTVPSGHETHLKDGIYYDTLSATNGCDSILFIDLTVYGNQQSWKLAKTIYGDSTHDYLGNCVETSRNGYTLAIGASNNDHGNNNKGYVQVYRKTDSGFVQKGNNIYGKETGEHFGRSIDLSSDGNIIAISNIHYDLYRGYVRVYEWNGSSWIQKGNDLTETSTGTSFGNSISLSSNGHKLAIGSEDISKARVYTWTGSSWVQQGNAIQGNDDNLGQMVDIDSIGKTFAVGAPNSEDDSGLARGDVRIYKWNGSSWNQLGEKILPKENSDGTGYHIDLDASGKRILIGADSHNNNRGNARVFQWNGSSWNQMGPTLSGKPDDRFGSSISISSDGNSIAVGAGLGNGYVKTFKWNGSDWELQDKKVPWNDIGMVRTRTVDLNLDGKSLAIGEASNDSAGTDAGRVKLYYYRSELESFNHKTACNSYTIAGGNKTYTENGIYQDTIKSAAGCDSIINFKLNIKESFDTSVTISNGTLKANASDASYQWLNCANGKTPVNSANNQTFDPSSNGAYAVKISRNGCADTSGCHQVTAKGILENDFGNALSVYPNPTRGKLFIEFTKPYKDVTISLMSSTGKQVLKKDMGTGKAFRLNVNAAAGLYLLKINAASGKTARMRVIKQ